MAQIIDFTAALKRRQEAENNRRIKNLMDQVDPCYGVETPDGLIELDVFTVAVDERRVYLLLASPEASSLTYFMVIPHDGEVLSEDGYTMSVQEMKLFRELCLGVNDERSMLTIQLLEKGIKLLEPEAPKAKKPRKKKEAKTDVQ